MNFGNEQRRVIRALQAGERLHFRPDLPPYVSPARISHGDGLYWTTVARRVPQSLIDRGVIANDGDGWRLVEGTVPDEL